MEVKPETRMRPLKGGRWWCRVQRWVRAVATAVPSDWPKRIMWDGRMVGEDGGGVESFGVRPVRKDRMLSASVVRPASVGDPVLRPNPR